MTSESRNAHRLAIIGYSALALVGLAVFVSSFSGLLAFATGPLGITSPLRFLVPISLDAAALTTVFLSLRAAVENEPADGARFLTFGFMSGSAAANITQGLQAGNIASAIYYGAMSVALVFLLEVVLRHVRRGVLRKLVGPSILRAPITRYGALAWARFPRRAWTALSEEVAARIPTGHPTGRPPVVTATATIVAGPPPVAPVVHPERDALTSLGSDAARVVAAVEQGQATNLHAVTTWLGERGVTVTPDAARSALRRHQARNAPPLGHPATNGSTPGRATEPVQ